jgi:hypothetical protein
MISSATNCVPRPIVMKSYMRARSISSTTLATRRQTASRSVSSRTTTCPCEPASHVGLRRKGVGSRAAARSRSRRDRTGSNTGPGNPRSRQAVRISTLSRERTTFGPGPRRPSCAHASATATIANSLNATTASAPTSRATSTIVSGIGAS